MRIDFHARERQFVDHLAAVWRALPEHLRGRFMVPKDLAYHAQDRGLPADRPGSDPSVPVVVASYGDLRVVRRDGRKRIALLQHGIGQSYGAALGSSKDGPSYAGGRDNDDVGLFLVPNEHAASRWRESYPGARVEVVGCPKLDELPRREPGPGPVVAFTFHWDAHVVNETRSGFLQFRPSVVAAKRHWTILGHGHPRLLEDKRLGVVRFYARNGIECTTDFEEVCRRADVLVFDNTSAGYEFASTGRPVVVLDPIPYRRNVDHGLRFWEAADVGVRVDRRAKVVDAIARALELRPADVAARERALSIVYGYRTGAARRAADVILDWAHERVDAGAYDPPERIGLAAEV